MTNLSESIRNATAVLAERDGNVTAQAIVAEDRTAAQAFAAARLVRAIAAR